MTTATTMAIGEAVEQAYREHWSRLLALLVTRTRRFDVAEDALQDAFVAATRTWPRQGVPANPGAWLLTAARRRVSRENYRLMYSYRNTQFRSRRSRRNTYGNTFTYDPV